MFDSIFYHMGLKVKVRPVMKDLPDDEDLERLKDEDDEEDDEEDSGRRTDFEAHSRLIGTKLHGLTSDDLGYFEGDDYRPKTTVCQTGPHHAPKHAE